MVWVRSIEAGSPIVEQTIGALSDAGIDDDSDARAGSSQGIIFLTRPWIDVSSELVVLLQRRDARVIVVVTRSHYNDRDCWNIVDSGASDVVIVDALEEGAVHVVARLQRWQEANALLAKHQKALALIGNSTCWKQAMFRLVSAARFLETPILLMGETGTGKELAARLAHRVMDGPRHRKFTIVDCTAIVPTLAGSEFFGHERGAFTGATATREGALAEADGGTLFLDEIGELPLDLQAQLLRVLQEGCYKRVGGNTWRQSHFRLISATNRNLAAEVDAGRFRQDLYFRIGGSVIELPPLRDRPGDILALADAFLTDAVSDSERPELTEPVRSFLLKRDYVGNVRDLKQLCRSMVNAHPGSSLITVGDIPEEHRRSRVEIHPTEELAHAVERAVSTGMGLNEIKEAAAEAAIAVATLEAGGNLVQAAAALQVTPRTLQIRRKKRGD